MPRPRPFRFLVALVVALCCAGLAGLGWATVGGDPLGERLVAPGGVSPLMDDENIAAALATLPNRSGHVDTSAGVPLFWRAVDPGDYRMRYAYRGLRKGPDGHSRLDYALAFDVPAAATPAPTPRGTVVLLHGWMMDGDSLLPWALDLAQAGYRTITVDLRNHGRSGDGPTGYGTREAGDVADLVQALRARGEITGPLHLFGVSYGAATALFTARKLGDQVAGVVALESFDNAGGAIRDMVPHMLAIEPEGFTAQAAARLARWRYGGQDLDTVIRGANDRLALDLDRVDVGNAARIASATSCVLIAHGGKDAHIPVAHGRALAAAAPAAEYLEFAGEDHLSLPMRLDLLGGPVADWLAAAGDGRCAAHRVAAVASVH